METITCNPDAGRTIMGFRDTGYTLNTAVADIVDNSINAQADNIWIEINLDPAEVLQIRIFDDGYGMNREELIDGMRYGSSEKKEGNALGRFGLGLKTASSSICKKLSVVSRKSKNSKLLLARWDLDLVNDKDDWLLQVGEADEEYSELYQEHLSDSGTMVCWDNIDRIRDGDFDSISVSPNVLGQKRRHLRDHLAMIFHRFIEDKKLNIFLDGEKIIPWNPFAPNESTETYIKKNFSVSIPGSRKKYKILLAAHVLPNKYEFS
ncbi:MAG: ATP-binding protein, partial [Nitrospina sp.]|nr:ATP-binding protein [Nitrospina sp.]